jgi:predicted transcriptional regulator
VTRSSDSTMEPPAAAAGRRQLRVAHDRHADAQTRAAPTAKLALDGLLELLERRRLSATELRILLAVLDREVPVSELAETFGRRSLDIRRAAARLYARGLVRWRHDAWSGEAVFGITRAGLATVRPLLIAAGAAP